MASHCQTIFLIASLTIKYNSVPSDVSTHTFVIVSICRHAHCCHIDTSLDELKSVGGFKELPVHLATPAPLCDRSQRLPHAYQRPTGSGAPAPISAPQGARAAQPSTFHGQLCSRAHFHTSRCPPPAAYAQLVCESHGQPRSQSHFNTPSCPPKAALEHVSAPHGAGGSCARAHRNTTRCPP